MKRLKMGKVKTWEWCVLFLLLPVLGKSYCPMPAVFFIMNIQFQKLFQCFSSFFDLYWCFFLSKFYLSGVYLTWWVWNRGAAKGVI